MTLNKKLVKIATKIVRHGGCAILQMVEIAISTSMSDDISHRMDRFKLTPAPASPARHA